ECEPLTVQPRRGNGVNLASDGVAHDHDPQIFGGHAGPAQGYEFRDRVIFAVTAAGREVDKRRTPHVNLAILVQITHWMDCEIDGAVDLAEAGASLAGFRIVHDGEKAKRRRRCAAFPIPLA